MEIYLYMKKERVIGWGNTRGSDEDIVFQVDPNHEVIKNPFIFKILNGQLIKDEEYQNKLTAEQEERMNKPSPQEEIVLLRKQNADLAFELMMKGLL